MLHLSQPHQADQQEELIGCAGNCSTYHCYKGGPEEPPAGLETAGCPVYSHPAQLVDNRNCVLCMTCDKARPYSRPQSPSTCLCHYYWHHCKQYRVLYILLINKLCI